jgi:hypothetical protein
MKVFCIMFLKHFINMKFFGDFKEEIHYHVLKNYKWQQCCRCDHLENLCSVICCTPIKYYNIWATLALVHQIINIITKINLTLRFLILKFLGDFFFNKTTNDFKAFLVILVVRWFSLNIICFDKVKVQSWLSINATITKFWLKF